jgi:hypothetical protein
MSKARKLVGLVAAALALAGGGSALAQSTFKWVDAQGRTHYGDQPPPTGAVELSVARAGAGADTGPGALPPALGKVARSYPVVLYVTDDCNPCALGRKLLLERGVPYTEKKVSAADDVDAFRRLGFAELGFPAISVGRERSVGFDSQAWVRLLDAAGYPAESMLPPGLRPPAATALAPPAVRPGELTADAGAASDPSRLLDVPSITRTSSRPVPPPRDTGFRF